LQFTIAGKPASTWCGGYTIRLLSNNWLANRPASSDRYLFYAQIICDMRSPRCYIGGMESLPVTERVGDAAAIGRDHGGSVAAKRIRTRKLLTKTDGRTAVGLRIAALTRLFEGSLGDRPMTASLKMKIEQAAQLTAFAETARGRWLRGESSDRVDGICTAERLASAAVAKLRLADDLAVKPMSLEDYLASKQDPDDGDDL
jgi:hypothetical protein